MQTLAQAEQGPLAATPQPSEGVNYAHKIEKHEALIDWSHSATEIARRIRAFDPFPGACTTLQGETIKLWNSQIDSCSRLSGEGLRPISSKNPGEILSADAQGVRVACNDSVLC